MKKFGFLWAMILGVVLTVGVAGCLSTVGERLENHDKKNPTVTQAAKPEITPDITPSASLDDGEIPVPKNDIMIYSLNSENLEKVAVSIKIDKADFSLNDLVKKITGSLEDESFVVSVKSAYFEKTIAIVDFSKNGAPGISASNYETTLLDCISQSIIENYDNCTAVVFRIDGKAYETDNIKLGFDQAYMIK